MPELNEQLDRLMEKICSQKPSSGRSLLLEDLQNYKDNYGRNVAQYFFQVGHYEALVLLKQQLSKENWFQLAMHQDAQGNTTGYYAYVAERTFNKNYTGLLLEGMTPVESANIILKIDGMGYHLIHLAAMHHQFELFCKLLDCLTKTRCFEAVTSISYKTDTYGEQSKRGNVRELLMLQCEPESAKTIDRFEVKIKRLIEEYEQSQTHWNRFWGLCFSREKMNVASCKVDGDTPVMYKT